MNPVISLDHHLRLQNIHARLQNLAKSIVTWSIDATISCSCVYKKNGLGFRIVVKEFTPPKQLHFWATSLTSCIQHYQNITQQPESVSVAAILSLFKESTSTPNTCHFPKRDKIGFKLHVLPDTIIQHIDVTHFSSAHARLNSPPDLTFFESPLTTGSTLLEYRSKHAIRSVSGSLHYIPTLSIAYNTTHFSVLTILSEMIRAIALQTKPHLRHTTYKTNLFQ